MTAFKIDHERNPAKQPACAGSGIPGATWPPVVYELVEALSPEDAIADIRQQIEYATTHGRDAQDIVDTIIGITERVQ